MAIVKKLNTYTDLHKGYPMLIPIQTNLLLSTSGALCYFWIFDTKTAIWKQTFKQISKTNVRFITQSIAGKNSKLFAFTRKAHIVKFNFKSDKPSYILSETSYPNLMSSTAKGFYYNNHYHLLIASRLTPDTVSHYKYNEETGLKFLHTIRQISSQILSRCTILVLTYDQKLVFVDYFKQSIAVYDLSSYSVKMIGLYSRSFHVWDTKSVLSFDETRIITIWNKSNEDYRQQKDTPHISVYNLINKKLEKCTLKLPNHFEKGNAVKSVCLFNTRNSCQIAASAFIRRECTNVKLPIVIIYLMTEFVVLPQDEIIHILYKNNTHYSIPFAAIIQNIKEHKQKEKQV